MREVPEQSSLGYSKAAFFMLPTTVLRPFETSSPMSCLIIAHGNSRKEGMVRTLHSAVKEGGGVTAQPRGNSRPKQRRKQQARSLVND